MLDDQVTPKYSQISAEMCKLNTSKDKAVHRGAFCQFSFRWIHYYDSNKSTRKETGKTHLYAVQCRVAKNCNFSSCIDKIIVANGKDLTINI